MEGLWAEVLKLAAVVEDALNQSVHALCDGRVELADEVKRQKRVVDRWEVQIEGECVRVLALHQPVASDLRRVAAVLKINGDLHRLCDLARHIAKRVKKLAGDPGPSDPPAAREPGARGAGTGPRQPRCADAVRRLPRPVRHRRRSVGSIFDYRAVQKQLKIEIAVTPSGSIPWLRLVNTARNLERIADHAAKIAESVIYLKEGDILRHQPDR